MQVSVIILTKNEEQSLPGCLASVREFYDVTVVDSHSDDATRCIAERSGAIVIDFAWNGAYPKKKQWALDHVSAQHPWVLLLDADERLTPALAAEVLSLDAAELEEASVAAFDVSLNYTFLGRRLKHGHRVSKRVLLRKLDVRFPEVDDLHVRTMWEVEGHYQPTVNGHVRSLSGRLEHNDEDPLFDYFSRHNRYSDWEAILTAEGSSGTIRGSRSRQGRLWARVPGKPALFFMYSYLLRAGFRDGYPGFAYAMVQAQYYWQIALKVRQFQARRLEKGCMQ